MTKPSGCAGRSPRASWTFLLFGATMVLFSTVRANGATWAPLVILTIAFYPVRLGFALGAQGMFGTDALWLAFPLGSAVAFALAVAYYWYGGWRKGELIVAAAGEEHAHADGEPAGRLQPSG